MSESNKRSSFQILFVLFSSPSPFIWKECLFEFYFHLFCSIPKNKYIFFLFPPLSASVSMSLLFLFINVFFGFYWSRVSFKFLFNLGFQFSFRFISGNSKPFVADCNLSSWFTSFCYQLESRMTAQSILICDKTIVKNFPFLFFLTFYRLPTVYGDT